MATYVKNNNSPDIIHHKIVLTLLFTFIGFITFFGAMMSFYYYDALAPWGLVFIVPFTLIILPLVILELLSWMSRKIVGDNSVFDLRHFADPQEKIRVQKPRRSYMKK
jgi:hypothetical protein